MKYTPKDVANWMLSELQRHGELQRIDTASDIETKFGPGFVSVSERGSPVIDRRVLAEFKKLHNGTVLYHRRTRCWIPKD